MSNDNASALVPRQSTADVVEIESASVANIASAFEQFQNIIMNMGPDDVYLDLESNRASTRISFRAYRKR
jgi:hypothetical protein